MAVIRLPHVPEVREVPDAVVHFDDGGGGAELQAPSSPAMRVGARFSFGSQVGNDLVDDGHFVLGCHRCAGRDSNPHALADRCF